MRFPAIAAAWLLPALALAQGGTVEPVTEPAKKVIILVNESVPDSLAVGRHYAKRRGIPEENLCRVKTTDKETLSWDEFRGQIMKPLGRFLEKFPEALYIVPVYGIPTQISEESPENDEPKDGPPGTMTKFVTNRDYACLDAELALIPRPGHELEGWIDSDLYGKDERVTPAHQLFLVSRLDGPSAAIAKALVDKAIYAETYGPVGEAYVDTRGLDKATPLGKTDEEIRESKAVFEAAGIVVHHEDTAEAQDLSAFKDCVFYWGWYAADYTGTAPHTFRPGAVAAHLHSQSAFSIRQDARQWVGPLLAHGATCTAGTVYEPLTVGFPTMGLVLERLFKGYTWGEACALGNRKLSWMAVFVGDPLYAPFAKGLKEAQEQNRALASESYGKAAAAIDAGDLDGAQKTIDEVRKIAVPMEGAQDTAFLAREITSRRLGKVSGTVADLVKKLDEARAARERGDDKAAQTAMEKAVGHSSMSYDANFTLGSFLVEVGKAQQALSSLEKSQKSHPGSLELREPLGRALAANGKFDLAIPLLEDAVQDGAGSDCIAVLGDCFLKTRQAAKAVLFLTDATKKDAKNRAAFVALAKAHEESKDIPSALLAFKEAVKIYPEKTDQIVPYKDAWRAFYVTVGRGKDKREKEDVEWVIRDFDNIEYQPPTKGVALEIAKQADAAVGTDSPVSLGTIPGEAMKVPGLPRLVVGNASSAEVTIFLKGSCARLIKMNPLATPTATGKDYGVYPGDYDVLVMVKRGPDKTLLSGRVTFELNVSYGMVLDNSLALKFPAR
ncbi:MAG: TIGR03790 family protein [Planctomycetota bacterium]